MLARQRERGIDVGSSISAATGALGGGSLCCRLDNPHGWLWPFGRVRLPICAASPAP